MSTSKKRQIKMHRGSFGGCIEVGHHRQWLNDFSLEDLFRRIDENRVATITPRDEQWSGYEDITFVAMDRGRVVTAVSTLGFCNCTATALSKTKT